MNKENIKITFSDGASCIEVAAGTRLSDVLVASGKMQETPCGGIGKCGKCQVRVNGEMLLACQFLIDKDIRVELAGIQEQGSQILMSGNAENARGFAPGKLPEDVKHPYLAAVDVGTTTVVAYLIDGLSGAHVAAASMMNPQRKYGADVVARCSYSISNGREILSQAIRDAVNDLFAQLAEEQQCHVEDIVKVMFVGNTGMHHLFLELPTEKLALAPYIPYEKSAITMRAQDCDLHIHPQAEISWLPNIGGFVGADTVGCLVAANMAEETPMTLLVDIGTNGEMVLGNAEDLLACSTAAGPAFEGAKITCGMHGSIGAIDKVYIEDDQIRYHVIGDVEARGICGSGLLDAAACLLQQGLLDESGRLEETFYFNESVFLNQKDIRELQLAKAAIAAGIDLLCMRKGIAIENIDRVFLAGAFGNYMNAESACGIGMLPAALIDRIVPIGNAAGEGAKIAVSNEKTFEEIKKMAAEVRFLELALDPEFQDIYVDHLWFGDEEEL